MIQVIAMIEKNQPCDIRKPAKHFTIANVCPFFQFKGLFAKISDCKRQKKNRNPETGFR